MSMFYNRNPKNSKDILENVVKGFAKACRENSCVLIGGETAEMPGTYDNEKFDLAGNYAF